MIQMKSNKGFTLVELIVVIAILAILAGIAIPAYSGYIEKANKTADITTLDAVKTATFATYATEGSVTKIEITTGNTDTIAVEVDGAAVADAATNEDFLLYLNMDAFDIELKTGDTAVWNAAAIEADAVNNVAAEAAGWTITE